MPDSQVENFKFEKINTIIYTEDFQSPARAISSPERHPALELLNQRSFFLWTVLASLDLDSRTQKESGSNLLTDPDLQHGFCCFCRSASESAMDTSSGAGPSSQPPAQVGLDNRHSFLYEWGGGEVPR
jgi:hypothetical protein